MAAEMEYGERASVTDLARLWACRLLLNGRGYRGLDGRRCRMNDDMCRLILLDPERAGEDRSYVRRRLKSVLRRTESHVRRWPLPLADRLEELGDRLSLGAAEREILGLMTLLTLSEELRDAAQTTCQTAHLDNLGLAAVALDRPVAELAPLMRPTSRLARSGLLHLHAKRERRSMRLMDDAEALAFELLDGLPTALTVETESIDHLLGRYFEPVAREAGTGACDFRHCGEEERRIGAVIDHALEHDEVGVNVLIHGVPGVGKTEFVRALAARQGWDLFAVSASDGEEQSLTGGQRFRACQLCQLLLEDRDRGVLLFDEIEDVFERRFAMLADESGGYAGKAWTNRLLESNARPVVWVSNSTDALDPAYLRRFDYILRMDVPSRTVRRAMLGSVLEGTSVPASWLDRRASDPDMTPARISQVGRLANRLEAVLSPTELPEVLDDQLEQRRSTEPGTPARQARRPDVLGVYDLAFLNTVPSVADLLEGLQRQGHGTVLMHGAPGTGKTAFAEQVAELLGRELEMRTASELLDKYLGETEKGLAEMFRQASRSRAILLLDEADNFLSARSSAERHWQVTQTNELLVQMERFDGVFLCATNSLEALDAAAMRRFDVKMEFRCLAPDQRWAMLAVVAHALGIPMPGGRETDVLRRRLDALDRLTAGDFAAAARGNALLASSPSSVGDLVDALAAEQDHRPDARRQPGFIQ